MLKKKLWMVLMIMLILISAACSYGNNGSAVASDGNL